MNKLTKIFIVSVLALIVFMFMTAPDVKRINRNKIDFHVNASDRLFFKNLRQYYYVSAPTKNGQFDAFALKKEMEDASAHLRFKIINNWRMDEAYIFLSDTNDQVSGRFELILDSTYVWHLDKIDAREQLAMAAAVYEALQQEESRFRFLSKEDQVTALWETPDARQLTKTVLHDYFKLVGAI